MDGNIDGHFVVTRHRLLPVLLIALAVAGTAWWASDFMRVMRSILPGIGSPSASMQPRELVFRANLSSHRENKSDAQGAQAEWRVSVPRAYVWSEIGDDAAVSRGPGHQLHSIDLYAVLDPVSKSFSPGVFSDRRTGASEGFIIHVTNGFTAERVDATDNCVRLDDIPKQFASQKLKQTCSSNPKIVRCPVYMKYKGWHMNVAMPKKYY